MTSETYDESFKKDCGYKDICQIKSGKFSTVYKATRVTSGKVFAVKVLKNDENDLKEYRRIMQDEINFLKQMNHDNIIKIYGSYISKGRLVLELAKGGDLNDAIKNRNGLDELSAWHVINQVIDATDYLHNELRIQHNDIKPENILLMTNDKLPLVKLTDFNLSSVRGKAKTEGGTVQYSAPEKLSAQIANIPRGNETKKKTTKSLIVPPKIRALKGRKKTEAKPTTNSTLIAKCKAKVDVWAIGLTLYKMCTNENMFSSANPRIVLDEINKGKITNRIAKKLVVTSCDLKTFVKECLEIEQENRASIKDLKRHKWIKTAPVDDTAPYIKAKKIVRNFFFVCFCFCICICICFCICIYLMSY